MISFQDRWVWDFWLAHDGRDHHLFHLNAPRSLGAEQRRHRPARIGHATSADLVHWTHHDPVLELEPAERSNRSRWTGSVVRGPDGRWAMFYTEARHLVPEPGLSNIQTVAVATSPDLYRWTTDSATVTSADPRWYETLGESTWTEQAWRDPWVEKNADGHGWDMLVTARSRPGPEFGDDDAGVVGRAWSPDLTTWQVQPPSSRPGSGFGHLEVPQTATIDGQRFLLFSCAHDALSSRRRQEGRAGGIWSVPFPADEGTVDVADATLLSDERYYSGRLVQDPTLGPVLLAVVNRDDQGEFVGEISDPLPVRVGADGQLTLVEINPTPSPPQPKSAIDKEKS